MDFYIADSSLEDLCIVPESAEIDIEIGESTDNDFVLTVPYTDYDEALYPVGGFLYSEGTEYGGILADPKESTSDETITFNGDTFRGLLDKKVVCPPSGSDYLTLSGTLAECLTTLFEQCESGLFEVVATASDTVSGWQVDRYCTLLEAANKLLKAYGYHLTLEADSITTDELRILVDAEPNTDHSDEMEVSQDSDISFKIQKTSRKYTYMVCGGSGDLSARLIVYLHLCDDGTVEQVSSIPTDYTENVYFYDDNNTDNTADLIEHGTEKFGDINETDEQEVTFESDIDYQIGDIVGGRSYVTGFTVSEPISQKIIKVSNNQLSISYKVGD